MQNRDSALGVRNNIVTTIKKRRHQSSFSSVITLVNLATTSVDRSLAVTHSSGITFGELKASPAPYTVEGIPPATVM